MSEGKVYIEDQLIGTVTGWSISDKPYPDDIYTLMPDVDNFYGIDHQKGVSIAGSIVTESSLITPEIIDQAAKIMSERDLRPFCQDSNGVFRHLGSPFVPGTCITCGWII